MQRYALDMSTTVRLKPRTHEALKQIAQIAGETLQQALENSVDERHRRVYLKRLQVDYADLRADGRASAEFDNDSMLWECTTADGLVDA